MSQVINIDKVRSFVDPRLIQLEQQLKPKSNKINSNIPQQCDLLKSANNYVKYKLSTQHVLPPQRSSTEDDQISCSSVAFTNKTINNRGSRRPGKSSFAKRHHQDLSEVISNLPQQVNSSQFEGLILQENYIDQPKVVLNYILQREPHKYQLSECEKDIVSGWKMCLSREDRMEVERQRTWFPNPRNIQMRHITAGLAQIYGTGNRRRLRPGEEATIMQTIQKFLKECIKNPAQIALRDNTIYDTILGYAQLEELSKYPFCMKQLQYHFKIMATRWRYSGKLNMLDKQLEKALYTAQNRGHFLDLSKKQNALVKFMLKYSRSGQEDELAVIKNTRNSHSYSYKRNQSVRMDSMNNSMMSQLTRR